MPCPTGGHESNGFKSDRQSGQGGIVLLGIFAETGKSRLSVKPRLVGGELHLTPQRITASSISFLTYSLASRELRKNGLNPRFFDLEMNS